MKPGNLSPEWRLILFRGTKRRPIKGDDSMRCSRRLRETRYECAKRGRLAMALAASTLNMVLERRLELLLTRKKLQYSAVATTVFLYRSVRPQSRGSAAQSKPTLKLATVQ